MIFAIIFFIIGIVCLFLIGKDIAIILQINKNNTSKIGSMRKGINEFKGKVISNPSLITPF